MEKAAGEAADAGGQELSVGKKSNQQVRHGPTLPTVLTQYGMESKDTPPKKAKPTEKEKKKKKKKQAFREDYEMDEEREKRRVEERHLKIVEDISKLRDYYYKEYNTRLRSKIEQQRQAIRQRSDAMQEKIDKEEETARQESHHVKRRHRRQTLISDHSFLAHIPQSDFYRIVALQQLLVKDGKLRCQSDIDQFWRNAQDPDFIAFLHELEPSEDISTNYNAVNTNLNAVMRKEKPKLLSLGAIFSKSGLGGRRQTGGGHWAVTQQFPANFKEKRHSVGGEKSHQVPGQKSSYYQILEKRFPKLEMPKLHCFTMSLGPKPPDPDEVHHELIIHEREKKRKSYTLKLTRMHQLAMANAAAASRILEMKEDIDFIINGHQLRDLISDQYYYTGMTLPRQEPEPPRIPSTSHTAIAGDLNFISPPRPTGDKDEDRREGHETKHKRKKKKKKSGLDSGVPNVREKTQPVPLSLQEVPSTDKIVEAKCLSTKWTNYANGVPSTA